MRPTFLLRAKNILYHRSRSAQSAEEQERIKAFCLRNTAVYTRYTPQTYVHIYDVHDLETTNNNHDQLIMITNRLAPKAALVSVCSSTAYMVELNMFCVGSRGRLRAHPGHPLFSSSSVLFLPGLLPVHFSLNLCRPQALISTPTSFSTHVLVTLGKSLFFSLLTLPLKPVWTTR